MAKKDLIWKLACTNVTPGIIIKDLGIKEGFSCKDLDFLYESYYMHQKNLSEGEIGTAVAQAGKIDKAARWLLTTPFFQKTMQDKDMSMFQKARKVANWLLGQAIGKGLGGIFLAMKVAWIAIKALKSGEVGGKVADIMFGSPFKKGKVESKPGYEYAQGQKESVQSPAPLTQKDNASNLIEVFKVARKSGEELILTD